MSASTQTLQTRRPIRIPTLVIVVLLAASALITLGISLGTEGSQPVLRAPAISTEAHFSPGSGAVGRNAWRVADASTRPSIFRDGSVKIGAPAGFVPSHGPGDFRGGPARDVSAAGAIGSESPQRPMPIGDFVCHQCR